MQDNTETTLKLDGEEVDAKVVNCHLNFPFDYPKRDEGKVEKEYDVSLNDVDGVCKLIRNEVENIYLKWVTPEEVHEFETQLTRHNFEMDLSVDMKSGKRNCGLKIHRVEEDRDGS